MRLVDTEDVIDALGNMGEAIDLRKAEEWIDTVPTAMQLWTSVKDALPTSDGIYFVVYKFWSLDDCVSTREFRGGEWREEVGREEVRFWMPIPALPEDDE
jgi:hypothetical protein|nr:MAG TPA: Protein of unknown function (DUF551) [Caudoviricetes sp.]